MNNNVFYFTIALILTIPVLGTAVGITQLPILLGAEAPVSAIALIIRTRQNRKMNDEFSQAFNILGEK